MKLLLPAVMAVLTLFSGVSAQDARESQEDIIRCYTVEADAIRRANNPALGTLEDFETWMAPKVREYEQTSVAQRAVVTIPIVFHIIHNNGADNLSATYINAQIDQLNNDFRRTGSGFNNHPDGADAEIEFCAAIVDPSGNTLAEPGINRVSRTSAGFTSPPYSQSYYESTIKPGTIWDPTQYCNVWVSDLSGGLLGYAQFPEAGSLPGIGTGNGGASTDGVVVIYTSVGSTSTPHPQGGVYARGRTLTHELGHWLGLRHIWGDGGCNVDDYCDDTPRASSSTSGCPTKNTCNDLNYGASSDPNDMVENYMDYSYDNCMNIFTSDQKARMQVVLSSSIRRASLTTSNKCGGGSSDTEAPTTPTALSVSEITSSSAKLDWLASSDNVGVTGYNVYLEGSLLGTVTGNTATLTGLSANTNYTAGVRALDAAGNLSGQATVNFTTLPLTCVDGSLTLTITFDDYPEETSWDIKTSGGATVASGGTYGSQPDGSTLTENISLGAGDYTFTIYDQYGDGICCGYGNGSYSLTSGATVIASGAGFTSSEATDFCVEAAGPDTQAPSVPGNVNATNITQTTASVTWSAASDNVGVTGYNVFLDGSFLGSTAGTSYNLTGLTASTVYTVCVTAYDAAGNESGTGCDNFVTDDAPDTEDPTAPTNVTATNITQTTADVNWNASTDNVGVTGYNVYINGSLVGTVAGTSASLSGLSANTNYTVTVSAVDAAGNESAPGTDNFTTLSNGGGGCVGGNLVLTIVLDNYPQETTWDVKTSGGSTVASGGPYGSQPDGSTVTESINLTAGDYTFTIYDSYGDGICCGYGNGSYTLVSGSDIIASGGSFNSSDATNFCVSGGGGDTEAPTVPVNVTAVNILRTTATAVWSPSTDNVGVVGYNVYLNGGSVGSTTSTAFGLSGLSAGTNYTVCVSAYDAAGNESATDCDNFTTAASPDIQPPGTPTGVTVSNIAETAADVSWNAASDNVGVVSYNVYVDGLLVTNVPGTSASLSGLSANTTYVVTVTALDAAGNESSGGTATFTTDGSGGPSTQQLFGHYFESGWDGWIDGGTDCFRFNGSRSYEGNYSIRLRDNSGTASSMTLYNVDVSGWDQLELQFYFYPWSMENGEDFWFRVNDGSGWQTVASYARGSDFENGSFYVATVTMDNSSFNFGTPMDFRFQADASGNSDWVYIDEVTLTATKAGRNLTGVTQTVTELGAYNASGIYGESSTAAIDVFEGELLVYPNPARDRINLVSNSDAEVVRIYSATGMLVGEYALAEEGITSIDIADLKAGTYIVHLQTDGEVIYDKFIKFD